MKRQLLTGALAAGALAIGSLWQVSSAEAFTVGVNTFGQKSTFGFDNITNNNPTNAATEGQYFLDVWEVLDAAGNATNEVLFNIRNAGPEQSTISEVYFDDGTLLGLSGLIDSNENTALDTYITTLDYSKVNFNKGSANPGELPGGNSFDFNTSAGFLADAVTPEPRNGVNTEEVLGILFTLKEKSPGVKQTYQDVIAAIQMAKFNQDVVGALRIGIHVKNFANGGSESFINTGQGTPVPAPALIPSLMGVGLAALRKKKREDELVEANTQEPEYSQV